MLLIVLIDVPGHPQTSNTAAIDWKSELKSNDSKLSLHAKKILVKKTKENRITQKSLNPENAPMLSPESIKDIQEATKGINSTDDGILKSPTGPSTVPMDYSKYKSEFSNGQVPTPGQATDYARNKADAEAKQKQVIFILELLGILILISVVLYVIFKLVKKELPYS